jgi:hypothetical protein
MVNPARQPVLEVRACRRYGFYRMVPVARRALPRGGDSPKGLEGELHRLVGMLKEAAERQLKPLLRRFMFPSRREVHRLSRRIAQLERRLPRGGSQRDASAVKHGRSSETAPVPSNGPFDSVKCAELFWDEV